MVWAYNEAARATGLYPVIDVITHIDPSIIRLILHPHFGFVADEADGVLHYAVTDPAEMLPWLLS